MCHSRVINNKINRLHGKAYVYHTGTSFEKLLEHNKSAKIHTGNLQILAKEISKVYRNTTPPIFSVIFY